MGSLIHQWVREQAEERGDQVALVMREESMTYTQLEERSNQLARLLRAAGCKRGDRVCFLMPKSHTAIVSLLGILKADCIYVPLDTTSPAARLTKIIAACEPRCILTDGPVIPLLDELSPGEQLASVVIGCMGNEVFESKQFKATFSRSDLTRYSDRPLDSKNKGHDAAHILFTSGSTGAPKGVVITHANVTHFIEWAVKYFGMRPADRISGHSPLYFDLSTFDVFGTFAAGAQLHLVPHELNLLPHKLAEFIRRSELTQWFSVPSMLNYMAKLDVIKFNDFPALERLLWCGEVFPTTALIYWMTRLPQVRFTNLYGPTEATIASSYYTMPECPQDESVAIPIGTACTGEELLVLDEELRPMPRGRVGHLYLKGVGLSPGYWQDAAKTTEAFLPAPDGLSGDRIYRTGDLAQVGEDGLVYFLGRVDTQIKSRGYRIELGEIETALHALKVLEECAVVAARSEGFEGMSICCAYVPLNNGDSSPATLRGLLSKGLPSYMLPSRWLSLDRLPRNANGKIDRRELKESFEQAISSTSQGGVKKLSRAD